MIYTIGDSHSSFGWDLNIVQNHYMGSVLCHSIGKYGVERCHLDRVRGLADGDVVIFCFGEIDVRCHVHTQVLRSCDRSYQHILQELVKNYVNAIQDIVKKCSKKHLKVGVYNIPPPSRKSLETMNIHYPYQGSDAERREYTLFMNECLRQECLLKGYVFVDVYFNYVDEHGFLDARKSDGSIHIVDGTYIDAFIRNTFPTYL